MKIDRIRNECAKLQAVLDEAKAQRKHVEVSSMTKRQQQFAQARRESDMRRKAELERVKQSLEARDAFAKRVERQYSSVKQERDHYKAHAEALAAALRSSIYCKREDVVRVIEQAEAALAAWDKAEKGGAP